MRSCTPAAGAVAEFVLLGSGMDLAEGDRMVA